MCCVCVCVVCVVCVCTTGYLGYTGLGPQVTMGSFSTCPLFCKGSGVRDLEKLMPNASPLLRFCGSP